MSFAANPMSPAQPSRLKSPLPDGQTGGASGFKLEKVCRLCRKNRRGVAAVEFAIVAPVFFLLVLGMIEFGRMIMVQQIITNASREGARIAVLDGATTSGVTSTVTNYLESSGVSGANVQVSPDPPDTATWGQPVAVTVEIGFDQVSWLPSPMFLRGDGGGSFMLTSTTSMRRETVQ
jgi:hypothetical protein